MIATKLSDKYTIWISKYTRRYTKEDFLNLAEDYYMDEPFGKGELLKDEMKRWTLQELQSWFGFTHRDDYTGDSK